MNPEDERLQLALSILSGRHVQLSEKELFFLFERDYETDFTPREDIREVAEQIVYKALMDAEQRVRDAQEKYDQALQRLAEAQSKLT
jgi:hypothetical protein